MPAENHVTLAGFTATELARIPPGFPSAIRVGRRMSSG